MHAEMNALHLPQVVFNYSGEAENADSNEWFSLEDHAPGRDIAPDFLSSYPLEVTAGMGRTGELWMNFSAPAALSNLIGKLAGEVSLQAGAFASACNDNQAVAGLDYDGFAGDADLDSFLKGL